MNQLLKTFILALFILLAPLVGVFDAQDDGVYTYVFHLYFDDGKLFKDRDHEFSFDLIAEETILSDEISLDSYVGQIFSVTGEKLAVFDLNISAGDKGKSSPRSPY